MLDFKFKFQKKEYSSKKQKPTGRELLEIACFTPASDYELFFKIGNKEFEPIQEDETVDLAQPGIERFYVKRRNEIPYLLDDEYYSTYECLVTPSQLLKANGIDSEKFYLVQIDGHREINYKKDNDHEISLRPNMKFITCKKSATTVSFITTTGVANMEKELQELGYNPTKPRADMVAFEFEVPLGRFKGRTIQIALQAPKFPQIPPSGPYIKPCLLPAKNGGTHPSGGILNRNIPNNQWQYWSRPFKDWNETDKSMKTYVAFLRTLFDFQ